MHVIEECCTKYRGFVLGVWGCEGAGKSALVQCVLSKQSLRLSELFQGGVISLSLAGCTTERDIFNNIASQLPQFAPLSFKRLASSGIESALPFGTPLMDLEAVVLDTLNEDLSQRRRRLLVIDSDCFGERSFGCASSDYYTDGDDDCPLDVLLGSVLERLRAWGGCVVAIRRNFWPGHPPPLTRHQQLVEERKVQQRRLAQQQLRHRRLGASCSVQPPTDVSMRLLVEQPPPPFYVDAALEIPLCISSAADQELRQLASILWRHSSPDTAFLDDVCLSARGCPEALLALARCVRS